MTARLDPPTFDQYGFTMHIQTRWSDNDMFGHVNNVEYYRFFEMVVVEFLTKRAGLDALSSPVRPFAAESLCRFVKPLSWPHAVVGALRIEHVGTSSVRYGLALFDGNDIQAAAHGHWVHVFVGAESGRPEPIPDAVRQVFLAHQ